MRLLFLLTAGLAIAQSNPSWWKYAPPESTSLAGIQWKMLRMSLVAPILEAEMAPGGSFGFPDMEILRDAEQLVIGSPSMLVVEYGVFPIAKVRAQAAAAGLKRSLFERAEIYAAPDSADHSVAYISERLLLVGPLRALQETIGRVNDAKNRAYSPLLARAARYSKEDLWVVAEKLPDPLAGLFVPIQMQATAFEGSVSFWDGLHMVAAIERASPTSAMDLADSLAQDLAAKPAMAEATEITTRERSVLIRMDLDEMQLISSLRSPNVNVMEAAAVEPHTPAVAKPQAKAFVPPPEKPVVAVAAAPVVTAAIPEAMAPAAVAPSSPQVSLPPAPPAPKKIRIVGLDSGTVEIPLGQ